MIEKRLLTPNGTLNHAMAGSARNWSSTPPETQDERFQAIASIGERIATLVTFMCNLNGLQGASNEVKEKATQAFFERLIAAEKHLTHIQNKLQLE